MENEEIIRSIADEAIEDIERNSSLPEFQREVLLTAAERIARCRMDYVEIKKHLENALHNKNRAASIERVVHLLGLNN